MAGEWPIISIDNLKAPSRNAIAMGPFGSRIRTENFVPQGVPIIRGGNLNAERFLDDDFVYLTEEKADELRSANAASLDIVITHRGTIGQVGIIPRGARHPRYVVSQSQLKLTVDQSKADPYFVFYYLRSPEGQHQLLANSSQTGVPAIASPTRALKAIQLPCPALPEQRAIAHILGALDDKIELNRRMNETLEAMVRALFKSWFVDFDPVRAKHALSKVVRAEGRPSTSSGQAIPGPPEHLADLLPDSFEDSELGEIPAGWRVGKVGDFATLNRDSLSPGEFPDEMFDHFSIPAFDEGRSPKLETGGAIKSNKCIVPPEGVLLSKLNPRIPRIWLPALRSSHRAVCSTEFLITLPKQGVSREFLFCLFSSDNFADVFATLVTGTSGSHQRVKPEGLLAIDTVVPTEPAIHQFTTVAKPLLERISRKIDESCTLAALRDTLLPKLLSGEVRIKHAEQLLKDAI
jgi:type I restriction enzyme S subunit